MSIQRLHQKAEVLVPRTHIWWTLLALSADIGDGSYECEFVKYISPEAEAVIVDAGMIGDIINLVCKRTRVSLILWDGYQSYLEYDRSIGELGKRVAAVELWAVGDPAEWIAGSSEHQSRLLFGQSESCYGSAVLSPERLQHFRFPDELTKLTVVHRSALITLKVMLQLTVTRRWKDYTRARFVFCGQSGLWTLHRYSHRYGIDPGACIYEDGGVGCDQAFLERWATSILRNKCDWTSRLAMRALFRLIAIRALARHRGRDIFLNLYPARNLNAYQAGSLFRHHVFLEFGGINGEEVVYPRTADLAFQGRRSIRFERDGVMQRMLALDESDSSVISSLIREYEQYVISLLEREAPSQALSE